MNAVKQFHVTFRKVVRAMSSPMPWMKAMTAEELRNKFREAMVKDHVPATPGRVAIVNTWVCRASRFGGAV